MPRNPLNLAAAGRCTMTTRTTLGHVLRSKGYTLEGCLRMVSLASHNPIVSEVTIHTDESDRQFTRATLGAPLMEASNG